MNPHRESHNTGPCCPDPPSTGNTTKTATHARRCQRRRTNSGGNEHETKVTMNDKSSRRKTRSIDCPTDDEPHDHLNSSTNNRETSRPPLCPNSSEKSYLKSRRAQHRAEKRQHILEFLDKNVVSTPNGGNVFTLSDRSEDLPILYHAASPNPSQLQQGSQTTVTSTAKGYQSQTSTTSTAPTMSSRSEATLTSPPTSPVPVQPKRRMNLMNIFRRDAQSDDEENKNIKIIKRRSNSAHARSMFRDSTAPTSKTARIRNAPTTVKKIKKKERRNSTSCVEHTTETTKLLQEQIQNKYVVEQVLKSYPKSQCQTFEDHQQFALAELTLHTESLQMTPKAIFKLKVALRKRLQSLHDSQQHDKDQDDKILQDAIVSDVPTSPRRRRRQSMGSIGSSTVAASNTTASTTTKSKRRSSKKKRSVLKVQETMETPSTPHREKTVRTSNSVTTQPSPQVLEALQSSLVSMEAAPDDSSKTMKNSPPPTPASPPKTTYRRQRSNSTSATNNSSLSHPYHTIKEELRLSSSIKPQPVKVIDVMMIDTSGALGKYSGYISDKTGKPHGLGRMEYSHVEADEDTSHHKNAKIYQGEWIQGQWYGRGKLIHTNGDVYEGEFCDDQKHGQGTYQYQKDDRVFKGRYVMGHRVEGTMYYSDQSIYQGQWYNGKRHGRGIYQFSDQSQYQGEFMEDRIHGQGTLLWPDGSKYIGEWSQGMRHGKGKEYDRHGHKRFDGIWKQNKPMEQQ